MRPTGPPDSSAEPRRPGKIAAALREDLHLLALSGAAVLAAVTGQFWLIGLGSALAEALYLVFVPDSAWYQQRLDRRHNKEIARRREQLKRRLLSEIDDADRDRFARLERLQRDLVQQYEGPHREWAQDILRRVDYLVDHFLTYAHKAAQFERYLRSLWAALPWAPEESQRRGRARDEPAEDTIIEALTRHYDQEIEDLQARHETETEEAQRAALARHIDILSQRREQAQRMVTFVRSMRHQMDLIEDLLGLLSDQMRAQPPQQVLSDIDDVIRTSESVKQTLEELAPLEEQIQRLQQGL